ncbi:hypothetical protein BDM02DRAFT_3188875 [Thelephora ganbajun]|uniref:Uncharacterized protein n=1 Tax=Thelephora ganbajun TaxID=370292 RepID=A0ACB6Z9Z0_THEGA|nr:hypothetical protein BDM02DRAFT_3188875 [Thelephora ganbajun]
MVLRLRGYGAWIESDGIPLEEYAVEVKDNIISCYVCSEEGKKFVLHFDDDGSHYLEQTIPFGHYGRSIKVKMDGQQVENLWGDSMKKLRSVGVYVGDIVRPYIFAPITTTDDDDVAARDDPNNEHIGTIEVEIRRSTKTGPGITTVNGTAPSTRPIHERSKKAGSHRIVLGEGTYSPQNVVMVSYIDHTPWLTFRFLYRKRDILQAQGIIPLSSSPSPPPDNLPGPPVKVEGKEDKGKGVKRERGENGNDDVVEIVSDDDDLDALQDELKRIQGRIARKKAKKSVKRELVSSADDIIDLT